ncbi:MAG: VWA domain-containing protein [Candidatus Lokiarchaeota archaeon]|nr:VWA domain-containing protein [Candidatus Lokiarchaeota archaeon]
MIKEILEKYRKKVNLVLIVHRLESLIESTTDTTVKLESQNNANTDEKEKQSWCYNPTQKIIYYPEKGDTAIQNLKEEEIIGIILHEIGHAKYTDVPVIDVKDIPMPKYGFAQLLNAMEDIRIEKRMTGRYPGTYDSFIIEAKLGDELLPKKQIKQLPAHANFLANIIRLSWNLKPYFSKKTEEVFKKVKDDLEKAYCSSDTNTMIDQYILPKIWDSYSELFEEEQENKNQEENPQAQEHQEGDMPKDNTKKPAEKNQTGKEKRKEKREKKQKEELQNACQNLSNIKDILNKLKNETRSSQKKKEEPNLHQPKALVGFNKDEKERENSLTINDSNYYKLTKYESYYADVLPYIHFFSKKLGSIIIDNQLRRKGGAFRSGKLNNKMLYKFRCNNPKLFSKNIMRLHKEYSVVLVVDESGSMHGERMENAIRTVVLLGEVLDKCNVPFSIVGFNENLKNYKNFNEAYNWEIKRKIETMLMRPMQDGGATTDVWGIAEARYKMKQKDGEKIIIVITDGYSAPANCPIPKYLKSLLPRQYNSWDDIYIKDEIKRATQERNILLGVGIQTDYVKQIYPQSAVIYDVKQLSKQVLNLLKRNIKRG